MDKVDWTKPIGLKNINGTARYLGERETKTPMKFIVAVKRKQDRDEWVYYSDEFGAAPGMIGREVVNVPPSLPFQADRLGWYRTRDGGKAWVNVILPDGLEAAYRVRGYGLYGVTYTWTIGGLLSVGAESFGDLVEYLGEQP